MFFLAVNQICNQLGVDWVFGNVGELVDHFRDDQGELAEKLIIEIKRFVKALVPKACVAMRASACSSESDHCLGDAFFFGEVAMNIF